MALKIFCSRCGIEIWESLTNPKYADLPDTLRMLQGLTIEDAMFVKCSDCALIGIEETYSKEWLEHTQAAIDEGIKERHEQSKI